MVHEKNIYYLRRHQPLITTFYLVIFVLLMNRLEFYLSGHEHYTYIISLYGPNCFFRRFSGHNLR